MSNRVGVFVTVLIEHLGDRAYPFALEQVCSSANDGDHHMAELWAKIADGIAEQDALAHQLS